MNVGQQLCIVCRTNINILTYSMKWDHEWSDHGVVRWFLYHEIFIHLLCKSFPGKYEVKFLVYLVIVLQVLFKVFHIPWNGFKCILLRIIWQNEKSIVLGWVNTFRTLAFWIFISLRVLCLFGGFFCFTERNLR